MLLELFGWKELTSTYSLEEQAHVRTALAGLGIGYKLKTVNRSSPSAISPSRRACTGTYGENQALSYEYLFYVKKQDLDAARGALRIGR